MKEIKPRVFLVMEKQIAGGEDHQANNYAVVAGITTHQHGLEPFVASLFVVTDALSTYQAVQRLGGSVPCVDATVNRHEYLAIERESCLNLIGSFTYFSILHMCGELGD